MALHTWWSHCRFLMYWRYGRAPQIKGLRLSTISISLILLCFSPSTLLPLVHSKANYNLLLRATCPHLGPSPHPFSTLYPPPSPLPDSGRGRDFWLVFVAVCSSSFLEALDFVSITTVSDFHPLIRMFRPPCPRRCPRW